MNLELDIFKELKRLRFKAGVAWVINMYNKFYPQLSYSVNLNQFVNTMNTLCKEGYFVIRDDGNYSAYILTEKGELHINNLL